MTRKIPNKPCVLFAAYHTSTMEHCKHCGKPTNMKVQAWVDYSYRQELEERGINSEYAAQLAMAASIRHQSKEDSQPYETVLLCRFHLLESTRRALNMADFSLIEPFYDQFVAGTMYIIFDKNQRDTITQPKLAIGPYTDIHNFLAVYD